MPATLKSRLPEIALSLNPRVRAAIGVGAEAVAVEASARCPRSDNAPHIADRIHVEPEGDGWSVVAGDSELFYGHLIEGGSYGGAVPPRPFLVPALESRTAAILAEVNAVLKTL